MCPLGNERFVKDSPCGRLIVEGMRAMCPLGNRQAPARELRRKKLVEGMRAMCPLGNKSPTTLIWVPLRTGGGNAGYVPAWKHIKALDAGDGLILRGGNAGYVPAWKHYVKAVLGALFYSDRGGNAGYVPAWKHLPSNGPDTLT